MNEEFVYSIEPHAALPDLGEDFLGVAFTTPEQVSAQGEWMLEGVFQLTPGQLAAVDEQPHRALALVAQLGGAWYADTPLRPKIFFPDDVHPAGQLVRGYFRFELFSLFRDRVAGEYTLSMALGEHLSDSTRVVVR